MKCECCGNTIHKSEKFCIYCGAKKEKRPIYKEFFSSKVVLILFVLTHLLCMVAMNSIDNVSGASGVLYFIIETLLLSIIMLIADPFVLVGIIFSALNILSYRKWRGICCVVCSVLMFIPIFILNAIASIEGGGLFAPDNIAMVFYIPYGILILICLLNVILELED